MPGYAHDRSSQEVSYRLTIDAQAFDCPTIEAAGDILEKAKDLALSHPEIRLPKIGYSSRDLRPLANRVKREIKDFIQSEDEHLLLLM